MKKENVRHNTPKKSTAREEGELKNYIHKAIPNFLPEYIKYGLDMGILAILNKEYTEALEHFNKFAQKKIEKNYDYSNEYLWIAFLKCKIEGSLEGIEFLNELESSHQQYGNFLYIKGRELAGLGRLDESIEYFNKAESLGVKYTDFFMEKAYVLESNKQYYEAIKYCDKVLKKHSGRLDALAEKANSLIKLNKNQDSIECFVNKEGKKYSYEWDFQFKFGKILTLSSEFTKALLYFNQALLLCPKNMHVDVLSHIAHVHNKQGDINKTVEYFDRAEKLIIKDPYNDVGSTSRKLYSISILNIACSDANSTYANFFYYKAIFLHNNVKDYKTALEYYNKARDFGINTLELYKALGDLSISLGKDKDALCYYDKAEKFGMEISESYRVKGKLLEKDGQQKAALELYRELEKSGMETLELYEAIAELSALCFLTKQAIEYYNKAIYFCNEGLIKNPESEDMCVLKGTLLEKIHELKELEKTEITNECIFDFKTSYFYSKNTTAESPEELNFGDDTRKTIYEVGDETDSYTDIVNRKFTNRTESNFETGLRSDKRSYTDIRTTKVMDKEYDIGDLSRHDQVIPKSYGNGNKESNVVKIRTQNKLYTYTPDYKSYDHQRISEEVGSNRSSDDSQNSYIPIVQQGSNFETCIGTRNTTYEVGDKTDLPNDTVNIFKSNSSKNILSGLTLDDHYGVQSIGEDNNSN